LKGPLTLAQQVAHALESAAFGILHALRRPPHEHVIDPPSTQSGPHPGE